MLVNGILNGPISAADRGLSYGDGVFRTLRIKNGQPRLWMRHYRKLKRDCVALGIACPSAEVLLDELCHLAEGQRDGIAKIIVTRGEGGRGYKPVDPSGVSTRILSLSSLPVYPGLFYTQGVRLRVCETRLSHQPKLAGIKHLNRLENVLAAAELTADDDEGVLLDISGNVIECTRNNLFIIKNNEISTPDLSRSGIAGIERERVIEWAAMHNVSCRIGEFGLPELRAADEIFIVNSVMGLWPVKALQGRSWSRFPVSLQIQEWLNASEE